MGVALSRCGYNNKHTIDDETERAVPAVSAVMDVSAALWEWKWLGRCRV